VHHPLHRNGQPEGIGKLRQRNSGSGAGGFPDSRLARAFCSNVRAHFTTQKGNTEIGADSSRPQSREIDHQRVDGETFQ